MESSQTQRSSSMGKPQDPIQMLEHDHREVEQLFTKFKQGAGSEKEKILREIKSELDRHMKVEEEIFYPAAEKKIREPKLVKEGIKEHNEARDILKKAMDVKMQDTMTKHATELEAAIRHHVGDEEHKMFPQVREAIKQEELMRLGSEMETRKQELKRK